MEVNNKYITVSYKLYTVEENGVKELVEEATKEHPFMFISGLGTTLVPFENAVVELNEGEKFEITISSEDAYGPRNEEYVFELPKNVFEVEGKFDADRVIEGAMIPMMTADGQPVNGIVQEVKDETVVMDMNHPLAGDTLHFEGEVVTSRPATNKEVEEMVKMMTGEGCSCGHDHGDGGCCGGHHGDGECCGGHGEGHHHGDGECCGGHHGDGECCGGHGEGHHHGDCCKN